MVTLGFNIVESWGISLCLRFQMTKDSGTVGALFGGGGWGGVGWGEVRMGQKEMGLRVRNIWWWGRNEAHQ
jgi:hypothetical protein